MSTEICWDKQMLMDLAPAPRFGLPGWSMLQSPVGESAIFHTFLLQARWGLNPLGLACLQEKCMKDVPLPLQ